MRKATILAFAAVGAALVFPAGGSIGTGSAAAMSRVDVPQCPRAKKPPHFVMSEPGPDGRTPLYTRACGRARATFELGGVRYRVRGGFCHLSKVTLAGGDVVWLLGVSVGVMTFYPAEPVAFGLFLMIDAGHRVRAGQASGDVFDSVIQVPGMDLAASGPADLRPRLAGGSFTLVTRGDKASINISGSWTCR